MRHGKQTAAFFLAAAMVMSSSPAVVFAEELESGAEQEAAATGALTELELTSGEQETTEQMGEAVLPEDNYRNPYHKRVAGRNGRTVELGIYRAGTEVYP